MKQTTDEIIKPKGKIEHYRGKDGKHYFRILASNGRILCNSDQGYNTHAMAHKAVNSIIRMIFTQNYRVIEYK